MNSNHYTNNFCIIAKQQDIEHWDTVIPNIETPATFTFAISSSQPEIAIKKIVWDFGKGNLPKNLTNRKQELNMFGIHCKYKKSHNSTITIQASVYTETDLHIPIPIETVTVNHVIKDHYVDPEVFKQQILDYYKTGVFTDAVGSSIYKIANRTAFAPNFINYCVDEKTEALTKRGWLKYNEITINDELLSSNIIDNQLVWGGIKEIFINDKYDGPMHKLTNQGIDALVTPGHKFLTTEHGLVKVEDLKTKDHITLMGKYVIDEPNHIYDNNFVKLVGWAVTEGNYLKGKNTQSLQIFQKEGPKSDMIRQCLNDLKIDYKEYEWTNKEIKCFRFKKEYANKIINDIAPNKILNTEFILDLTHKQRLLLIETMINGDGWIITQNNRNTIGYNQKCKKHIDSFLMLCTLCGFTTTTEKIKNETPFGLSEYYSVYVYNKPKIECSIEHTNFYGGKPSPGGNIRKGKKPNTPTQHYKGVVWCPKTEYGNFICRRGKYIYITGNTYREEMIGDAVIRMIEALTTKKYDPKKGNPFSYYTKITINAFKNRLKKEKKMRIALTNYQNEVYEEMRNEGLLPYSRHDTSIDYNGESIDE